MARQSISPQELLTPRERQVLDLLAAGLTNAEIADVLGISYMTARNHVATILSKLDVNTREAAVDWWCTTPDTGGLGSGWKRWLRGLVPTFGMGPLKLAAGGVAVAGVGAVTVAAVAIGMSMSQRTIPASEAEATGIAATATPSPAATATPTPTMRPFVPAAVEVAPELAQARAAGTPEQLVLMRNAQPGDAADASFATHVEAMGGCYASVGYTVLGPTMHGPTGRRSRSSVRRNRGVHRNALPVATTPASCSTRTRCLPRRRWMHASIRWGAMSGTASCRRLSGAWLRTAS